MKQNAGIGYRQVVFSRWSRKNYAIFCSLGKHIKIARLTIDICNVAMLKSAAIREIPQLFSFISSIQDDTADPDPEMPALRQWLLLMPTTQSVETTPSGKILFINHIMGVCNGIFTIPASAFFLSLLWI